MGEALFKPGDIVALKSGGCNMIISSASLDDAGFWTYTCHWQDDRFEPHCVDYPQECLKKGLT